MKEEEEEKSPDGRFLSCLTNHKHTRLDWLRHIPLTIDFREEKSRFLLFSFLVFNEQN